MCLAVPMQVTSLNGLVARCEAKGIGRDVSLYLLQHEDIRLGDHLLVHVGFAIEKVSEEHARETLALLDDAPGGELEPAPDA